MKKVLLSSLTLIGSLIFTGCSVKIENNYYYNKILNKESHFEQILNSEKTVVDLDKITYIQKPFSSIPLEDENELIKKSKLKNLNENEVEAYLVTLSNKDKIYILHDLPLKTFIFYYKD